VRTLRPQAQKARLQSPAGSELSILTYPEFTMISARKQYMPGPQYAWLARVYKHLYPLRRFGTTCQMAYFPGTLRAKVKSHDLGGLL